MRFKYKLDDLKNKIDTLRFLETGVNISDKEAAFDLVLVTEFDDEAGLDTYRNHPDHQAVLPLIKELVEKVHVVDFLI